MSAPRYPAMIKHSAGARRAWRETWRLLEAEGEARDIYRPVVTALAMNLGMAEDSAAAVFTVRDPDTGERTPQTLEEYLAGRNSQTAQELTVLRDSLRQAAKIALEFGMTPGARSRLGVEEKSAEESPMMQYIRAANARMKERRVS